MKKDASFGIIPLKKVGDQWRTFVIQHRAGHWGFPKGHPLYEYEDQRQTATRELKEETGFSVVRYLVDEPFVVAYECVSHGQHVDKTAAFFAAEVDGEMALCPVEVAQGCWDTFEEARAHLVFRDIRKIVDEIENLL